MSLDPLGRPDRAPLTAAPVVLPQPGIELHQSPPAARDERTGRAAVSPSLHVLTDAQYLAPVGGVELCTVQDSVALAGRGHRVDVVYGSDGSLR
ncbi:hypothetical protein SAMN06273567_1271, partial [Geodermatophilus aquaeductus]